MKQLQSSIPTASIIALVAMTRLLPHWPNFTPVMAIALCGGALFSNRLQSLAVAIGAMLASDIALGAVFGAEYALHATQPWVYACIVATALMGWTLRTSSTAKIVLLGGTASSIGFFLVTNFAVWLQGAFYPATFDGLMMCYAAGLAFYRESGNFLLNGMVSTYVFSLLIVVLSKSLQLKAAYSRG
jgi:hypothetical protein